MSSSIGGGMGSRILQMDDEEPGSWVMRILFATAFYGCVLVFQNRCESDSKKKSVFFL